MIHDLKILPEYYRAVIERRKTFEVRKNDRNFKVGDRVNLMEYDPDYAGKYTGRVCQCVITYILDDTKYCKKGYVILGIQEQ